MKIAVVVEVIDYHSGARAPLEIAKHLAQRNHKVVVFAYDRGLDKDAKKDLVRSGVAIVTLKTVFVPLIGRYLTAVSLFISIKKFQPQAIAFSGTLPFFLASTFSGIPCILMYHGIQPNAYLEKKIPGEPITIVDKFLNQIANFYIYSVNLILVYLSTDIVAISRFAAKEARVVFGKKVNNVIYLGATSFSPQKSPRKLKKKIINILSVSRITPYKGFHLIIEAMKKVKLEKKVILTIAGSQPKDKYVEYLKNIGGHNVKILLDLSDSKLVEVYEQSDIYVNADRYLYFGLPIYEAALLKKPTVTLDFAAAKEMVVHQKTGLIAHNMTEFTKFLTKLIKDESLRKVLGQNALQRTKKYTWEICAMRWETVLERYKTS